MNIGFDAKRLFRNRTGLGNYSRSLLRNLSVFNSKSRLHLFAPKAEKNNYNEDFFDAKNYSIHESYSLLKWYWRSFSIIKDLKANNIEIYHGLSNEIPFGLRRSGIRSVVTIHDLIFKIYPETYSFWERVVYDFKFKYACKYADKIIAISECTKNDIVRFYNIDPDKIEVVYQTCQPSFYSPCSDAENETTRIQYQLPENYFVYVGSVEKRKNLKSLIEAYRQNCAEIKIPTIIIGKGGQYKAECEAMIADYGLKSYFIWQNKLENNRDLQSIIQQATALIYPSFYEGFGLPVAEALLCKTPVVAASTSSLMEAGSEHSYYFDPHYPFSLAILLLQIIKYPEEVAIQVQQAFEYASDNFDPKNQTQKVVNLYQSILLQC